ncbi:hypothetical protein KLPMMA106B_22340 [Klebsiella pneumoniae]
MHQQNLVPGLVSCTYKGARHALCVFFLFVWHSSISMVGWAVALTGAGFLCSR